MQDYRKLKVWEKSHELTLAIYDSTTNFPKEEQFGLTSQLRRSASSIPANIAEGCGRNGNAELARFLQISMGSASELEYHLLLAHDWRLLNDLVHERLAEDVAQIKRMLATLIGRVRAI